MARVRALEENLCRGATYTTLVFYTSDLEYLEDLHDVTSWFRLFEILPHHLHHTPQ
jgi:hypothetical protein